MSSVNDASPWLIWAALAALALTAGLWLIARNLRVKRAGGGVPAGGPGGLEMAAILLLLFGGFFFLVGWVAGAVLLWVSPRWRLMDKLLGTLVWPGGLALALYPVPFAASTETCSGGTGIPTRCTWTGPPTWVGTVMLVIILLGQLATTVWLWRRARRLPSHDADGTRVTPAP